VVIVSHDRDFLDPIVSKVVEFRAGTVKTYLGSVSDFLAAKQKEHAAAAQDALRTAVSPGGERERKRAEAELRQRRYQKTQPVQREVDRIERTIAGLEERKAGLEALMADPGLYRDGDRAREINLEYKGLEQSLQDAYFRWNELTQKLERIKAEIR
jgi:ATP-binding cassette subfamily F protein 3